jgi:peptide/nickel transport system permease protein
MTGTTEPQALSAAIVPELDIQEQTNREQIKRSRFEPDSSVTDDMIPLREGFGVTLRRVIRSFASKPVTQASLAVFLLIVLCAIAAPLLSPHAPLEQNIFERLQGPSSAYPLGTDYYGRDILSRLLYGARTSLFIGFVATFGAMLLGTAIGLASGYYGGRLDMAIMQAMDVLLAFPALILGLIIVAMLGPSLTNLIIAIGLGAVPTFARVARAPTLAAKEREYVQACRALGYSDARIMAVHILPNIMTDVLVMGSLWLATAIRVEASLAFIGLGVKPPAPSWGGMIREGFENILDSSWLVLWPSLAILLVVFTLNLLGDSLRDVIDPKLRGEA